jgi:hypothetical protein
VGTLGALAPAAPLSTYWTDRKRRVRSGLSRAQTYVNTTHQPHPPTLEEDTHGRHGLGPVSSARIPFAIRRTLFPKDPWQQPAFTA